ncbi:EamA family transporter [Wohlfahrtiimonas larvae]|uniref:EamA family transporter n=1 Tax=Wohlfahrtiimonas larvae TaxID=1157986 RepID=A0ABP9MD41_9GAMM|nr:EamA family transporter [Wohlfahrtiimonas larvae]
MSRLTILLLTMLTPLIWGSTYIVTTELLPPNQPFLAALLRVLPAGLILVLCTRVLPKGKDWLKIAILGILNVGLMQAMIFVAAYRLPGGLAAILAAIQPIIVMILMSAVAKVQLPKAAWIAGVTGFLGMIIMLYSPNMKVDMVGVLAALTGALSMACGTFFSRYWKVNLPLFAFTGWQLLFAGLFILPIFLTMESWPTMTLTNIMGYIYLCLFGAVIAYILWFQGIKQLSPAIVSSLGLLTPVSAFILGWIFLGQKLSILSFVGLVIILGSIYVVQRSLGGSTKRQ